MNVLGVSCYAHDSAAVLMIGNKVVAAAQEERFTRIKNDKSFPFSAINFCLKQASISLQEVDIVVFYENPKLKQERITYTFFFTAPRQLMHFLNVARDWCFAKKKFTKRLTNDLKLIAPNFKGKLLFSQHHLSHAACAFFTSNFEESAILTIDGVGEFATAGIFYGCGNTIKLIKELKYPNSVGLLYSATTYFLGFKVDSGEYKVMGLAPYGNKKSPGFHLYKNIVFSKLVKIFDDGSIKLNQKYFNYFLGDSIIDEAEWEILFRVKRRVPEEEILQIHCDIALALQEITNEIVIKMASEAKKLTGSNNICIGGGVALNCVSNTKLLRASIFNQMHVHVASGDAGGALGAALAIRFIYLNMPRDHGNESLDSIYLGPEFYEKEIIETFQEYSIVYETVKSWDDIYDFTAKSLSEGKIVGWFQDRMEWGPRALGNRSILANPQKMEMQIKLNEKIKNREGFRPFAPAIIESEALKYFDILPSPEMTHVTDIKEGLRRDLPINFPDLPVKEKLRYIKSDLPAITHIDFSCRSQIVNETSNRKFWSLLNAFKKISGSPILINTSMNVRGEPIVCTPKDALGVFFKTELDYLVIQNYIICKEDNLGLQKIENLIKAFNFD